MIVQPDLLRHKAVSKRSTIGALTTSTTFKGLGVRNGKGSEFRVSVNILYSIHHTLELYGFLVLFAIFSDLYIARIPTQPDPRSPVLRIELWFLSPSQKSLHHLTNSDSEAMNVDV